MEAGSVIAKLKADLQSFEAAFTKAGRTVADFKREVEAKAIKVSLDDRSLAEARRAVASLRRRRTPAGGQLSEG